MFAPLHCASSPPLRPQAVLSPIPSSASLVLAGIAPEVKHIHVNF